MARRDRSPSERGRPRCEITASTRRKRSSSGIWLSFAAVGMAGWCGLPPSAGPACGTCEQREQGQCVDKRHFSCHSPMCGALRARATARAPLPTGLSDNRTRRVSDIDFHLTAVHVRFDNGSRYGLLHLASNARRRQRPRSWRSVRWWANTRQSLTCLPWQRVVFTEQGEASEMRVYIGPPFGLHVPTTQSKILHFSWVYRAYINS